MNDWPADPRLDASLRRLVDAELVAARTDAIGLSRRPGRRRDGRAIAGLGALAVIAIVAALVIRGTGSGPQAGAPGSSGSPVNSDGVAISSPSTLDTASPQSSVPTPTPSHTAAPTPRPSGHGTFSATGTMLNPGGMPILLKDGRVLIVGYDATSPQLYDP
jgi:hypothetical protein